MRVRAHRSHSKREHEVRNKFFYSLNAILSAAARHRWLGANWWGSSVLCDVFGKKSAADAARLFNGHPATVSRLLQRRRLNPVLRSIAP